MFNRASKMLSAVAMVMRGKAPPEPDTSDECAAECDELARIAGLFDAEKLRRIADGLRGDGHSSGGRVAMVADADYLDQLAGPK